MGFLKDQAKSDSFYLEITEEGSHNRPLAIKPMSVWVHKIHAVQQMGPNNQLVTIRNFAFETCTATGRNGSGCFLCNTPDPLWHMLAELDRSNRAGKRVDFPKTPRHFLPVFNHLLATVKIVEGGNQIFEMMDTWYDAQPDQGKDLRRCDWSISKTGKLKTTKYQSVRMDATPFAISAELEAEAQMILKKALDERRPTDPTKLMQLINGTLGTPGVDMSAPVLSAPPAQASFAPGQSAANQLNAGLAAPAVSQAFPAYAQPFQSPPPPVVAPTAPPVAAAVLPNPLQPPTGPAGQDVVNAFASWVAQQPEFAGMNAVYHLIPIVKEKLGGSVEYSKCSPAQLADLKNHLENHLNGIRAKKA